MGLASGSSVVAVRFSLGEIPPLTLVVLRLTVATSLFALTLVLLGRPLPQDRRTRLNIAVVGLTYMGIPLVAFTLALQFISSGVLTIFLALVPLYTALMAQRWLVQEKLNRRKVLGLAVGFVGVVVLLLTRTTGLAQEAADAGLRGHFLALGGTLSVAFATVYTRRNLQGTDVVVLTAGQMAVGLLAVLPLALLLSDPRWAAISWRSWLAVTYSAVVGSFVAFLIFFYLVRTYGATTASLPTYVIPAVSGGLGALLLGEVIGSALVAGAGLTLLGVFLSSRA